MKKKYGADPFNYKIKNINKIFIKNHKKVLQKSKVCYIIPLL